jgi:hypothetical protein
MDENQVLAQWKEIVLTVTETEPHVEKNARGVAAAGVRARKGLRMIKAKSAALVKLMVEIDKASKVVKPPKAKAKKA